MENLSTNLEDPSTNLEDPSTNVEDPTTNLENPTTNLDSPSINVEDPTTNSENPSINVEDPTTNLENPTTNLEDPTTNLENPSTNVEDPSTNLENPTTNVEDPTTTNNNNAIDIRRFMRSLPMQMVAFSTFISMEGWDHLRSSSLLFSDYFEPLETTTVYFKKSFLTSQGCVFDSSKDHARRVLAQLKSKDWHYLVLPDISCRDGLHTIILVNNVNREGKSIRPRFCVALDVSYGPSSAEYQVEEACRLCFNLWCFLNCCLWDTDICMLEPSVEPSSDEYYHCVEYPFSSSIEQLIRFLERYTAE